MSIRNLIFILIWGFFCCLPSLSASTESDINVFWNSGVQHYERKTLNLGTNLAITPNGNILGNTKYSEDGGITWKEIVGKPTNVFYYTVDHNSRDILANGGPQHPTLPIIQWRSKDNGLTWLKETSMMYEDENGWLSSRNSCDAGITLKYGKHKGRLIAASRIFVGYDNQKYFHYHYSNAIYSDNGGKTWYPSKPFPYIGTGEAGLVELSDGTIYYNSRCHTRIGNRLTARSYDGGVTWVDFKEDDYLPDGPPAYYGCKGGLTRLPIDDMDILIFSQNDVPENKDSTIHSNADRKNLTVWASFDGGRTWPVKRLVHEEGGYSSLVAGVKGTPSEGFIFLSCSDGSFSKFNLAWLTNGKDWRSYIEKQNFSRKTVFTAGDKGINSYRIPSLATTKQGTLIVACEARKTSWRDKSPTDIAVKRSTDGGQTWSTLQFVTNGYDGKINVAYMDPLLLADNETGNIFLFTNMWPEDEAQHGAGNIPFMLVSDDDGLTWSDPVSMQGIFTFQQNSFLHGFGPGSGIQLQQAGVLNGRLIVPIRLREVSGTTTYDRNRVVYSDDNGLTWTKGNRMALMGEWQVAELSDGRLYYNSRANNNRYGGHSTNGGVSFNFFNDTSLPTIATGCQSSVLGYGDKLLYCGVTGGVRTENHDDRKNLELFVSTKGGEGDDGDFSNTWSQRVLLYSEAPGYSCMTKLPNGDVAIIFEAGDGNGFTIANDRLNGWIRLDLLIVPSGYFSNTSFSTKFIENDFIVTKDKIIFKQNLESQNYALYSISGSLIKFGTIQHKTLSIAEIPNGIYILRTHNKSYKFIKI